MIPQTAQLHELPDYWQDKIRKLRSENFTLRQRLKPDAELGESPVRLLHEIKKLRAECAKTRTQRNEARAELAALQAQASK